MKYGISLNIFKVLSISLLYILYFIPIMGSISLQSVFLHVSQTPQWLASHCTGDKFQTAKLSTALPLSTLPSSLLWPYWTFSCSLNAPCCLSSPSFGTCCPFCLEHALSSLSSGWSSLNLDWHVGCVHVLMLYLGRQSFDCVLQSALQIYCGWVYLFSFQMETSFLSSSVCVCMCVCLYFPP